MNIILFHVGSELPKHVETCLKQFRSENPNEVVWFLHNREISNSVFALVDKFNIRPILIDPTVFPIIDKRMNKYGHFWNITMKRIPIIASFAFLYNLTDIVIFENDVLIYYPIANIIDWLRDNSRGNCLLTRATDKDIITGFSYFYDSRSLLNISHFIFKRLFDYSNGNEFTNEMVLLSDYSYDTGKVELLPTIPSSLEYQSCIRLSYIFDPASWGQYVGGTPSNGKIPGWAENAHYIGKKILDKRYDVVWQNKKPFAKDLQSNTLTPIFNLHIHSKELQKYISYE